MKTLPLIVVLLALAVSVSAQEPEIAALKKQIAELTAQVKALTPKPDLKALKAQARKDYEATCAALGLTFSGVIVQRTPSVRVDVTCK